MQSVSARLNAAFMLLIGIILALFSAALYLWVKDRMERDLAHELSTHIHLPAEHLLARGEKDERRVDQDLTREIESFLKVHEALARISREDGEILYSSPGYSEDIPGYRSIREDFRSPRGEGYRIEFALSDVPIRTYLAQLRLFSAVSCPAVLALSGLLGYLFIKRALSPVEAIRRQAERISRGNVSERVPEPSS